MDIEFSDDADTILTQTINQLPGQELAVVSDEENVSDVCLQVLTGGERVVENQNHFMLGVLDCELAADLIKKEGPLSRYAGSLAPLVFCPPETEMQAIMDAVQELGVVPWFVLLTEGTGVGLVPPPTIFKTLARYFRQRPMDAKAYWIDVGLGMIDRKTPKPSSGPSNCYCCPHSYGGQQPHRLQRSEITDEDNYGNYLCPFHPNQRVNRSIGCTAC
ncbi:MAG TPA: hypothetical protein VLB46_20415 [Pyrinomonadaceae bacterium]|nr:hypothetical protein [Pyrinomonadaceae bacterium]